MNGVLPLLMSNGSLELNDEKVMQLVCKTVLRVSGFDFRSVKDLSSILLTVTR